MTVLFPCGRTLSRQVLSRSSFLLTRLSTTSSATRVSHAQNHPSSSLQAQNDTSRILNIVPQTRNYATGTATRAPGRPKSHTGRATAKRSAGSAKSTRAKKPATRKRAAKKAKPKKVAKPKPKATKKPLTEKGLQRKAARDRTELRKKALLTGAPKRLPSSAWVLCFVENGPKKGDGFSAGRSTKQAAQVYRNMNAEDRERLNHIANQNKAKNEAAYKKWLDGFTPLQIKEANHARDMLRKEAKAAGKTERFSHIKDERLVKVPVNAYSYFLKDRVASGDMKGLRLGEIAKLVAREWKDLSTSEKKPFADKQHEEKNRYLAEYRSVYGVNSPSQRASAEA